jgi:hypothetical protein
MRLSLIGLALLVSGVVLAGAPQADSGSAWNLVRELGEFPDGIPGAGNGSPEALRRIVAREERQWAVYEQLVKLGPDAFSALTRGLSDPDERIRVGVAFFLRIAGGGEFVRIPQMDIRSMVPALAKAAADPDIPTRNRSIQTLGFIGSAAKAALPALRAALSDAEPSVRQSAESAIWKIDGSWPWPNCKPATSASGSPTSVICSSR